MQFVLCRVSRAYLGLSVRKAISEREAVDLETSDWQGPVS